VCDGEAAATHLKGLEQREQGAALHRDAADGVDRGTELGGSDLLAV